LGHWLLLSFYLCLSLTIVTFHIIPLFLQLTSVIQSDAAIGQSPLDHFIPKLMRNFGRISEEASAGFDLDQFLQLEAAILARGLDVKTQWFAVAEILGELFVFKVLEFGLAGEHHPN